MALTDLFWAEWWIMVAIDITPFTNLWFLVIGRNASTIGLISYACFSRGNLDVSTSSKMFLWSASNTLSAIWIGTPTVASFIGPLENALITSQIIWQLKFNIICPWKFSRNSKVSFSRSQVQGMTMESIWFG